MNPNGKPPPVKLNAIDRAIAFFDPHRALHRVHARAQLGLAVRHFEGAALGRRTQGWVTSGTSANTAVGMSLGLLRDRSRDLYRNNEWIKKGVNALTNKSCGTGITPDIVARSPKQKAEIEARWAAWAGSTACDADGMSNFDALQWLVLKTDIEAGESIVRRRWRLPKDKLPVPLQLQALEPDYIDTSRDQLYTSSAAGGARLMQGVEFDAIGRRSAYYLFNSHPGDLNAWFNVESKPVPASEVIHSFFLERIGQVRGVPWTVPFLVRSRNLADYEDAVLLRQHIANLFAGVIKDAAGSDEIDPVDPNFVEPETIEPGTFIKLRNGKDVSFAQPPTPEGYGPFVTNQLRAIAAGFGITYESLTTDYSQTNYSSARAAWMEEERTLNDWRWKVLVPQFCARVFGWFLEAAELVGVDVDGVSATWTAPGRETVDPEKEANASVIEIRNGLKTRSEVLRERGYRPDQVNAALKQEMAIIDQNGLVLDSDPRQDVKRIAALKPVEPGAKPAAKPGS